MAQWVATANSRGAKYIPDPRVDEIQRGMQLALQARAQREADAMQARRIAEEARQYDQDLLFRRDAMAQQQLQSMAGMADQAWQRDFAERNMARQIDEQAARARQEQEDRLFARQSAADEARRREAAAQRGFALDERKLADAAADREARAREAAANREAAAADRAAREQAQIRAEKRDAQRRAAAELSRRLYEDSPRRAEAELAKLRAETEIRNAPLIAREKAQDAQDAASRAEAEAAAKQEVERILAEEAAAVANQAGGMFTRQLGAAEANDNWYSDLNLGIFPWVEKLPLSFNVYGREGFGPSGRYTKPKPALAGLLSAVDEAFVPKVRPGTPANEVPVTPQTRRQVEVLRSSLEQQIRGYFDDVRRRGYGNAEVDQAEAELLARLGALASGSPFANVEDAPPKGYQTRRPAPAPVR